MAIQVSIASGALCRIAVVVVCAIALGGCNTIGTRALSRGRGAYAEVITKTEDEQLLNIIVRERYDETTSMLAVASITASLRFRAQLGANVGVGDSSDVAGNLVPLSAGVAYEENPTISYVPLSGEDFMNRMLSPVPIGEWVLADGTVKRRDFSVALAVRHISGLRNPLIGEEAGSPRFGRFLELYTALRRSGVLHISRHLGATATAGFFWKFHGYDDEHSEKMRELFDLLGVNVRVDGSNISVPFRLDHGRSEDSVNVLTRSALDVIQVFGAGIEVPSDHLESGIVEPIKWTGPTSQPFITIRSSDGGWLASRPENATVAIRYRDNWFYIDSTDTRSKRAFLFLRTFIGIRLADPTSGQRAPVITVPVN